MIHHYEFAKAGPLVTRKTAAALSVAFALTVGGVIVFKPGWGSLSSVTRLHRTLEAGAQLTGVLVVLFTLGTYFYGRRKEDLQELEAQAQLEAVRHDAATRIAVAESHATARVSELDAKYGPRQLTADQRQALRRVLAEGAHYSVLVHSVSGDRETATFGQHLADVIAETGWRAKHENMAFFGAPHGLQIRCEGPVSEPRDARTADPLLCPGAATLARALSEAGQVVRVMIWPPTELDKYEKRIQLVVGYKP